MKEQYLKGVKKKILKTNISKESNITKTNLENLQNSDIIYKKNINMINLTNHTIKEVNTGNVYPPSGRVIRTENNNILTHNINGMNVKKGYLKNLGTEIPEKKENTIYIVSTMALKKIKMEDPDRTDFISPGPVVYQEQEVKTKTGTKFIKVKVGCNGFFSDYEELDAFRELNKIKESL